MTANDSFSIGRKFLIVAGIGALGVGLAAAAAQQSTSGTDAGTTTLKVYSRLTVLDVTATDASGRPVHELQQSDFTVLEDGKPQAIRNFEEVKSEWIEPPRELPPNVFTNLERPAPSAAVNILLLDFANEAPVDSTNLKQLSRSTQVQHYVKVAALDAIDKMPAGTRVAIVSMTNNLHILQGFTSNQAILKAAIEAAPYDLDGNGDAQHVQGDMRNRMVLEAFNQIAADVAGLKGRKNLIWFSMGNPQITDPNHDPAVPDYSKPLSLAYDRLTEAQVSVYPIYAGGAGLLGGRQLSLQMIAEATGGVAYSGTNDMATAVVQAINNGANYYSIAYAPPSEKFDGGYHKLEVKVNRQGVTLVFRKGYYADDLSKNRMTPGLTLSMSPPAAPKGNMKAPMSRGMPASSALLFDVGVEPSTAPAKPGDPPILGTLDPKLKDKKLERYGFQFVVPSEQIKFSDTARTPGGVAHKGVLEFDIAVYDDNEKLLTGLSQTLTMPLSDATYKDLLAKKAPVRFFQQIDMPPGQLFVRVGVLDPATDKTGTLELPLNVGKSAKKQAAAAAAGQSVL